MSKPSKTKYYSYLTVLIIFIIICIFYFTHMLTQIEHGTREEMSTSIGLFVILIVVTYSINGRVKQIKEDLK
ncbi:hypothetical protein LX73_0728 [Fodinibius salinus]|uniref:Uncharacterized protein n=1 Tax=Fodinibius salinus TaxID=860790 RepID=A0A5D3YMM3_9BACT|nr:hypothetical protein LX73_0728 [Fodinibius salinus]